MTTSNRGRRTPKKVRLPEKKIGPFHAGLGVAIWANSVETENGPRFFRSITIAPRRFRDNGTGEWKDSKSYRPADLSTLVLALEKAQEYCRCTPLPGQALEGDELQDAHIDDDGESVETPPSDA